MCVVECSTVGVINSGWGSGQTTGWWTLVMSVMAVFIDKTLPAAQLQRARFITKQGYTGKKR